MSLDARIARIAARQHGVFTLAQAIRAGASPSMVDRRVSSGRWERLHPRVFRVAGTPDTFQLQVLAACLACGDGAIASHRSAGALLQLDGVPDGFVEVTSPRRIRISNICARRASDLASVDVSKAGVIPISSPARTLVDLAAVLKRNALETALDDALRRGLLTSSRLRNAYERVWYLGRPGIGLIRELLEARPDRGSVPDSPLESMVLRLISKAGLPPPVLHHRVVDRGRTIAVIDLAYPREHVAIELDGYRYHHGRQQWQSDLARMNELTSRGWRVLRFTHENASARPQELIAAIRTSLVL